MDSAFICRANSRRAFARSSPDSSSQLQSITARNVLGSVQVAGVLTRLSALTGAIGARVNQPGLEDSSVAAASIGTISAKSISAFIRSAGKVASVTATGDFLGGVTGTGLTHLGSAATRDAVHERLGELCLRPQGSTYLFLDLGRFRRPGEPDALGILERIGLVGLERDERRDDDREALLHERGHLVTEALAPARGHHGERVATFEDGPDDFLLSGAKRVEAEDVFEDRVRHEVILACRHSGLPETGLSETGSVLFLLRDEARDRL